MKKLSPLKSIRSHCIWCANGFYEVIRECTAMTGTGLCPLHPLRMGRAVKGVSPLKTIRAKCLECVEGPKEVRECTGNILTGDMCPLHPYRFGKSGRQASEKQKEKLREARKKAIENA